MLFCYSQAVSTVHGSCLELSTMSSATPTVTSLTSIWHRKTGSRASQKLMDLLPYFCSLWRLNTQLGMGPGKLLLTVHMQLSSCLSRLFWDASFRPSWSVSSSPSFQDREIEVGPSSSAIKRS